MKTTKQKYTKYKSYFTGGVKSDRKNPYFAVSILQTHIPFRNIIKIPPP